MGGERFRARQYPWGTVLGESDMKRFYNFWFCFSRYILNLVLQNIYLQLPPVVVITSVQKAPNLSNLVCHVETNASIDFISIVKSILYLSQYIIFKVSWHYTEYLISSKVIYFHNRFLTLVRKFTYISFLKSIFF